MDKKEQFKNFISMHPTVIEYIKNKKMSMQEFYEIYDIYGEDENVWNKYFEKREDSSVDKLGELKGLLKNINLDNIEHHVNNAQKAISIIQELTKKTPEIIPKVERPITKFFGD